MEAAPDIVVSLWGVSKEEAVKIVKEKYAWDSCADGLMTIHPTITFEEALVLVAYYEDPNCKPSKEEEMLEIKDLEMRNFLKTTIKELCLLHRTLEFDELFVLAKYKLFKDKK